MSSRPHLRVWLGLCLLALACGPAPRPKDPSSVLKAYAQAIEAGEAARAYELLTEEARRTLPFEAFERMLADNPGEVRKLAQVLAGPAHPPYISATVTAPNGDTLELVFEQGAWKLQASAVDLYGQASPRQAVLSFIRAYENRRYDLLMRFVPDSKRDGLGPEKLKESFEGEQRKELDRWAAVLKREISGATLERLGDRATLTYGGTSSVGLLLEHGRWKIEDFYQ